ncbi:hypothetical protein ILYODFUR_019995 [Ilyodon furcidens]|uniref:Uncharacterized protein n=1 Tax=Ilyodon furcidens TaxID=33524 RepID=A0ABV0T9H7_9TELE
MIALQQKPGNQPLIEFRCAEAGNHLKHAGQCALRARVEKHWSKPPLNWFYSFTVTIKRKYTRPLVYAGPLFSPPCLPFTEGLQTFISPQLSEYSNAVFQSD